MKFKEFVNWCNERACDGCWGTLTAINCSSISCSDCRTLQILWLDEEYEEPEVDWSNVPVDTLIRVKENKIDEWVLRYFAKYKDGKIYAWDYGCTSKTTDCVAIWRYGEIVTEDIK